MSFETILTTEYNIKTATFGGEKTANRLPIRLFLEELHPKIPFEIVIELKKLKIEIVLFWYKSLKMI